MVERPLEIKDLKAFYYFKKKALYYTIINRQLYKQGGKGQPMQLVIDSLKERRKVISSYYNKLGYKGRESTYYRVFIRFF
jgi:chitinase